MFQTLVTLFSPAAHDVLLKTNIPHKELNQFPVL